MTAIRMYAQLYTCLLLGEMAHARAGTEPSAIQQESGLTSANVGETVTLQCFYEGDVAMHFSWYKQPLGEKPQVISTVYKYDEAPTFYHEFKGNPRFSVKSGKGINHLSISDIKSSDSALYYCGSAHSNVLKFGKGTILNIKVVEQSVPASVQPGDSVTLNCTIHTETCAREHSVYWFRHGSGESRPGVIYTHGDRSDQCEKSPVAGSLTQSCVYNLPKRNLSLSDAGMYYCAVASCGEILFGNGTKLDIQDLFIEKLSGEVSTENVNRSKCAFMAGTLCGFFLSYRPVYIPVEILYYLYIKVFLRIHLQLCLIVLGQVYRYKLNEFSSRFNGRLERKYNAPTKRRFMDIIHYFF
uniref:Ig-like domain-containing protein n=1 Tax=Hucho hucho TaxID=62062 RepID=A0A4W5JAL1_9TELE